MKTSSFSSSRGPRTPTTSNFKRFTSNATNSLISESQKTVRINTRQKERTVVANRGIETVAKNNHLYDTYLKLIQEISQIQCDIKPLRCRFVELQNLVLSGQQNENDDGDDVNNDKEMDETKISVQTPLFLFHVQNSQMQKHLKTAREAFSEAKIKKMQEEEERRRMNINTLKMNVQSMEETLDKYQSQLNQYKLSHVYESVQRQRDDIKKCTESLQNDIMRHNVLKKQFDSFNEEESSITENAKNVARLQRKLERERRRHFEKCEMLIALRNKQFREIEQAKGIAPKDKNVENAIYHIQSQEILAPFS